MRCIRALNDHTVTISKHREATSLLLVIKIMFYNAVVLSKLLYDSEENCELECDINTPGSIQMKHSYPLTTKNWQD